MFYCEKYSVLDMKCLKGLISAFYTAEDISASKKLLMRYVQQMVFDRPFPRYPDRHVANRIEKEIDDIVDIVRDLDERASIGRLPRFVTDDTDMIPSPQFNEGDARFLINKMDKMEAMIHSLQTTVYTLVARLNDKPHDSGSSVINNVQSLSEKPREQPRQQATGSLFIQSGIYTTAIDSTIANTVNNATWARMVEQELSKPESVLKPLNRPVISDARKLTNNDDGYILVESRKEKQKKRRLQELSLLEENGESVPPVRSKSSNKPLIIGKRSSNDSTTGSSALIAAAGPRKAVYCIDNVSSSVTDESLLDFVENLGVRVVSCYEVKPRLSRWQRERHVQPKHKTFRLCINKADNERLLVADAWAENISISKWFFKSGHGTFDENAGSNHHGKSTSTSTSASTLMNMDGVQVEVTGDETINLGDPAYPIGDGLESTPT